MRFDLKSLLPLVAGGLLLTLALVGYLLTNSGQREPRQFVPKPAETRRAPAEVKARPAPPIEKAPAELTPEEIAVQDERDIVRILLEQIDKTPPEMNEAWQEVVFRYIRDGEAMEQYMAAILADGARYQGVYNAQMAKAKQAPSRNPNAFIFSARNLIYARYSGGVSRDKLSTEARNLLALSLHVAQENATEEEREVNDEILTIFFRESSALYAALEEVTIEEGGDPRPWMVEHTRLLETAIVNRHLLIRGLRAEARERYSGSHLSAQPARVRISGWQKTVNDHLMDLGRLYIDAASRETTYKQKQQEAAESGFQTLAMVYRQSQSPEALRILREANRIQRYNLWQMARATWRAASEAARAGEAKRADDGYFKAKMQYLECLARLEESKKPTVTAELAALQQEIAAWVRERAAPAGG